MKKIVAFTIAGDEKNLEYAHMLEKSFKHFHPDIPFIIYGKEELDKNPDPMKFYRATPYFARELIKEYEIVLKLDADQLILGSLDYIFTHRYDIGSVLNINRVDPPRFGTVQVQGIAPQEYINCGLVAMQSKAFVDHWWALCNSPFFNRFQFREQDLLNYMFYFGGYRSMVFDHYNPIENYSAWHGVVAKGETVRSKLAERKDEKHIVIDPDEHGYPDKRVIVKALHWAGGPLEKKMDYQKQFPEEVIEYIDTILGKS